MNWVKKMIRKIRGWQPWVSNDMPLMDPKLISGMHVDIDLDVSCKAEELGEVLDMLTKLRAYIEGRPNVRNLRMERMVELNGVIWEDGELKSITMGEAESIFRDKQKKLEEGGKLHPSKEA